MTQSKAPPAVQLNVRIDPRLSDALDRRVAATKDTRAMTVDRALRRELRNELLDRKEPK